MVKRVYGKQSSLGHSPRVLSKLDKTKPAPRKRAPKKPAPKKPAPKKTVTGSPTKPVVAKCGDGTPIRTTTC